MNEFLIKLTDLYDSQSVILTSSTYFKDLDEWDSLVSLSLAAMVSDDYGRIISGDDIEKMNTVADLFAFVTKGQ